MADSAIAISAGSGTNIDTRTESTNSNHRQVIVVGDPATNAGVAPVDATAGLKVDLGADNDVTLATLPDTSGGDLAAINTALSGTLTVSGTVTANLSSTDNTVLDNIDSDLTTVIGHVDGIETLLGTMDADTSSLAGAVSGSEVQVDVVGALPAGTNAIGKLAANSGVDIGDVDVTSLPSTVHSADFDTGAGTDTTLAFGIAVPASGGAAVVPGDATSGLTVNLGANNDVTVTGTVDLGATDNGVLDAIAASVAGTLTVDGSGVTQPVSNAGLTELAAAINSSKVDVNIVSSDVATGGTSAADDADFTAGTTTGTPAMGVYESTPTSVTDGDLGAVGITAGRRLKTSATIDAALPAGTNAIGKLAANDAVDIGDVTINNATIAVTQSGTWDEIGINDSGNSITIDGTVTANLSATDNAVLDNIDADTSAIQTAVEAIKTAVEGTLTVTGGGGGTEYTEDAAAAANPVGNALILVREDARAGSLTSTDGDNVAARGNNKGELYVKSTDSDALLATIDADTSTLAAVDFATQTTLAAINAKLVTGTDIGDVTINNSTGAAAVNIQDGGNIITVDGTVTANLSATDNNVLDNIDADTSAIQTAVELLDDTVYTDGSGTPSKAIGVAGTDGTNPQIISTNSSGHVNIADGGNVITVDGTVSVSGVATAANQTTIIGHVDGIEGLLTTIDADTGGILTSVQTLDNAISGSEMQVDVVGALPAGTNAIGKLAANSGVDIGDVDVTSISAGTNTIGNVGLIGRTSGGMSIFRSIDLDESEEEVKGTAGQVFSITAFNTTDAPLYLKLYNATAASVTVGTTTPVLTFVVPGNANSDGAGFVWNNDIGFAFGTAISAAVTTAVADNDTGAPGANACIVNIGYA